MKIDMINIKNFVDERGELSFLQNSDIPFEIKRVYWMRGLADEERGRHAHYKTKQCIICLNGSCKIGLDDGNEKKELVLENNNKGLIIEPDFWHKLYDFSPECLLLVLASEEYDEKDYIKDYDEFKKVYLR